MNTWRKITFQLTFAVRSFVVTGCCLSFIYFLCLSLTFSENGCWCYWERKLDGNSLKCNFILHWKSMKLWWKRKKILIDEVFPHLVQLRDIFELCNMNGARIFRILPSMDISLWLFVKNSFLKSINLNFITFEPSI